MIQITDNIAAQRYQYGWELHESRPSKDKDGNPSTSTAITYHPSLRLVCRRVLDMAAGQADTVAEIGEKIDEVEGRLKSFISEATSAIPD